MSRARHEIESVAVPYWGGGGSRMARNLGKCLDLLSPLVTSFEDASTGTRLLTSLSAEGLSRKSVQAYYAAYKRALELSGVNTSAFPKAPTPPRKKRSCLTRPSALSVIATLSQNPVTSPTADVARLVLHAGLRPNVEALDPEAWRWKTMASSHGVMMVTGKGGHQREVVVTDPRTLRVKTAPCVSYRTACRHWARAVTSSAPKGTYSDGSTLPTLHSLRHLFASQIVDSTGRFDVARDMLGHASLTTTEIYVRSTADHTSLAEELLKRDTPERRRRAI